MTPETEIDLLVARCVAEAPMGLRKTAVDDVLLFWSTKPSPPAPLVYEAGIIVLLRGAKKGTAGGAEFVYDAGHYLVLTLPLPIECGHEASEAVPLCGLYIGLDREDLALLLAQIGDFEAGAPLIDANLIEPVAIDRGMSSVIDRLIAVMDDPVAGRVIGPLLTREALFYALQGPRGDALVAFSRHKGDEGRLDHVVRTIRRDITRPVSVEDMARLAGMSTSAFFRAFRARTGESPLQYVKRLRLHKARDLINFEGLKAGEAARQVGYESSSQFSREYKKYFGQNASQMHRSLGF